MLELVEAERRLPQGKLAGIASESKRAGRRQRLVFRRTWVTRLCLPFTYQTAGLERRPLDP